MKLTPHRTVPNRAREQKERVQAIVRDQLHGTGKVICRRCGATYGTMADVCEADLGEHCDGQREISAAWMRAGQRVGA